MAIESFISLGLVTAFLVGMAWYTSKHKTSEKNKKTTC